MTQVIKIQPEITVTLPEGKVLIDEDEYNRLKEDELFKQWGFDDLRAAVLNKASWWVTQEITSKYRDELSIENGGFVRYPSTNGVPWRMDAHKMSDWLKENWDKLDWEAKRLGGK
ncbi:DUF771 domain-containing protein [Lacticaseibacillus saniviri]|nr:DUF771 domain-containing protein [Lacticaseibacillus saniviri]